MKLLIVNDVELTVRFLKEQISWDACGITEVYAAYNAEEARELLSRNSIDIILCDIEMPGDNGIELIRWVKEKNLSCDTIFLTCHANFDYIHEALHLECMDYILFPTTAENILNAVRKVLLRRQENQRSNALKEYGRHYVEMHSSSGLSAGDPDNSQDIISNTVDYILQHISSPDLSVAKIAETNYLSISYLSRVFKKSRGISISQYIIQMRMELAAELLINTKETINAIALETGYDNPPYFTSTFKKYHGCTPSQFREMHPGTTP